VQGATTEFAWNGWGQPLRHSGRVSGKFLCVLLVSCDTGACCNCELKISVFWNVMICSLLGIPTLYRTVLPPSSG
jgi:hypothetical protein